MVLTLASRDWDLHRICCEVLAELGGGSWTISTFDDDFAGPTDLTIWDFDPDTRAPEDAFRETRRYLFLVDRKDLSAFRRIAGEAPAVVLLKPVTRPALRAFLEFGVAAGRQDMLQGLIQANLKLQEYEQDRTTFLADAVHEFRTPLMALNGYCSLLLDEHLGSLSDSQATVLRRMLHSTKRLSRMAAEMIQLSTDAARTPHAASEPGDIHKCLEQALHEVAPFAEDKRIDISAELGPQSGDLYFELAQIERLMINLLDNACKFTPVNGTIRIRGYAQFWERRIARPRRAVPAERRRSVCLEPNAYRIDISNSGNPIPAEYLRTIFEEYTSYSGGSDRSGGGLGLAICRDIVRRHEGRLWASNSGLGPVFSFVLPFRGASDPAKATGPANAAAARA